MRKLLLLALTWGACLRAEPDRTPYPTTPSPKGLQVQMVDDALALGIHHAGININLTSLVDLEKRPGNPRRTVDGQEFSFNEAYLKSLDAQIRPLSDKGVLVYLILLAYPSKKPAVDALVVHPDARSVQAGEVLRHQRRGRCLLQQHGAVGVGLQPTAKETRGGLIGQGCTSWQK